MSLQQGAQLRKPALATTDAKGNSPPFSRMCSTWFSHSTCILSLKAVLLLFVVESYLGNDCQLAPGIVSWKAPTRGPPPLRLSFLDVKMSCKPVSRNSRGAVQRKRFFFGSIFAARQEKAPPQHPVA